MPLADRPLADLLDAVAAPRPDPGGGCAAAWACALAAALVEMAAGIGARDHRSDLEGTARRAAELRAAALALADRDAQVYAAVLAARRDHDAAHEQAALAAAADPPLAVAAAAAEVADLAAHVARDGAQALRGDALVGALLADAASAAAAQLVEINLAAAPADPRLPAARAHARRAAAARATAPG